MVEFLFKKKRSFSYFDLEFGVYEMMKLPT